MNNPVSMARFDPTLGRLPTAVAYALFSEEDWVSTGNPAITTALAAASENTRIAWGCDWTVFRTWAQGRASQWAPEESARLRIPILPEVLVRFINDMMEGEEGRAGRSIATVRRYLSTLSTLHRLLDVPDPTKAQIVRNTLKASARRSGGQTQATPRAWARRWDPSAAECAAPAFPPTRRAWRGSGRSSSGASAAGIEVCGQHEIRRFRLEGEGTTGKARWDVCDIRLSYWRPSHQSRSEWGGSGGILIWHIVGASLAICCGTSSWRSASTAAKIGATRLVHSNR